MGYSPPSSPVDSDAEYSPKHKILKSVPETGQQKPESKSEVLPDPAVSKESPSDKSTTSNKIKDETSPFIGANEEVDFPDNDDEWSDEAQEILVRPYKTDLTSKEPAPFTQSKVDEKSNTAAKEAYMETVPISKTSFMQDDIYDRESFDYDYDPSSPLNDVDDRGLNNAKERFLSDPKTLNASTAQNDVPEHPSLNEYPQDPYSCFQSETQSSLNKHEFNKKKTTGIVEDDLENSNTISLQNTKAGHRAPETTGNPDSTDSSVSEPTDSFVEFMRECLKSRQDEDPDSVLQGAPSKNELCKTSLPPSQPPPTMVMDLEQEQLTISALKELGSSQEEEEAVNPQSKVSDQDQAVQQSSFTSAPNPPCSQSSRVFDSTYSKEVEAIDEWVAEAYHLAEHVLTAILTHLSGNTFFFLGSRPANLMQPPQQVPFYHLDLVTAHSFSNLVSIGFLFSRFLWFVGCGLPLHT